ncbi:hypothetical protein KCP75_13900 [Salmonella enterica subsp. enterica]|nr:hypothetical protein KCP75_13900 [Salmonella enterica subsp. enterica]
MAGGFNGPVLPVTPARKAVLGVMAAGHRQSSLHPDHSYLCITPLSQSRYWTYAGAKGCKTCIIAAPRHNAEELLLPVPGIIKCVC